MATPPVSVSPKKDTILIVEDHALVAKFYRMALERAGGFACMITEDVGRILEAVQDGGVKLAILDISLKESMWEGRRVDGLELAHLIRQRAVGPLPIVIATAHAMVGDRERLLEASGADAYLEKPVYDAEQLVGLVRRLLAENFPADGSDSAPSVPESPGASS